MQACCLTAQAMEYLAEDAQEALGEACMALLRQRLQPAIAQDVELLSDGERDRAFNAASSIFLRLPRMAAPALEGDEQQAFQQVRFLAAREPHELLHSSPQQLQHSAQHHHPTRQSTTRTWFPFLLMRLWQHRFVGQMAAGCAGGWRAAEICGEAADKPVFQRHMLALREVLNVLHTELNFVCDIQQSPVQVAGVQREFVEKLLTKPVFQRHMTAVREVLNMLRAAQKIRDQGGDWDGASIKVHPHF
jgi:hypothetical protein